LPVVKKYAKILRTIEECDMVVLSIHDYDEALNANVAKLVDDERIDLILCGHTHTNNFQEFTRADGKKIIAVQNQDKNRSASHILVNMFDKEYISSKFTRIYPSNYEIDYEFNLKLSKYDNYISLGERVLGNTSTTISKSTLGYYSTSAMTEYFDVDFSIINTAGVRSSITRGDITVSDVFNAFPFNNEVFVVKLKGSEVISLYNKNGSFLYLDKNFNINNIVSGNTYEIAVIDYVFTGVYYSEFKNKEYVDTNVLLRDLLIEYIDELY
jgi:2',3'-cyclic-nucleotide 2'-phosphodiesterase (5'-nucleotidase family)